MFDFIRDLCHDVVANYRDAAEHAPPIDWSGLGGVPWLLGMALAMLVGVIWVGITETRRERATARKKLYEEARVKGLIRVNRLRRRGYLEYCDK